MKHFWGKKKAPVSGSNGSRGSRTLHVSPWAHAAMLFGVFAVTLYIFISLVPKFANWVVDSVVEWRVGTEHPESSASDLSETTQLVNDAYWDAGPMFAPCTGKKVEPYPVTCLLAGQYLGLRAVDVEASKTKTDVNPNLTVLAAVQELANNQILALEKKKGLEPRTESAWGYIQIAASTTPVSEAVTEEKVQSGEEVNPCLLEGSGLHQPLTELGQCLNDTYALPTAQAVEENPLPDVTWWRIFSVIMAFIFAVLFHYNKTQDFMIGTVKNLTPHGVHRAKGKLTKRPIAGELESGQHPDITVEHRGGER